MFPPSQTPAQPNIDNQARILTPGANYTGAYKTGYSNYFTGQKFAGGLEAPNYSTLDYWSLRLYSAKLYNENLYARGLIRRLVTNEINTGLMPECAPDKEILGVGDEELQDWNELTESRFAVWANNKQLCDRHERQTFAAIQKTARIESLVTGDVLIVLHVSRTNGLPKIQLISGDRVRQPLSDRINLRAGHEIVQGVEMDRRGRLVAHWVVQADNTHKRIPAYGSKSGRRVSWLMYGCDKRLEDVRGQPILSLALQSLSEIDKYRDSAQRKALINSFLAMFVKKGQDKIGSLPITGGAVRTGTVNANDTAGGRDYNIAQQIPGIVIEELQHGEEPVGFDSKGTDVNFGPFEEVIIQAVAWGNEIPPEILRLAFSNNYSASQAAINEFRIYINKVWGEMDDGLCGPIYQEWLLAESLAGKNTYAEQLLSAYRDPLQYDNYGAWVACDWYGAAKPTTDTLKSAKGSTILVDQAWSTNSRESRILTGTKFSKNAKRLARENQLKADAMRPLAEFRREFGISPDSIDPVQQDGEEVVIDPDVATIRLVTDNDEIIGVDA